MPSRIIVTQNTVESASTTASNATGGYTDLIVCPSITVNGFDIDIVFREGTIDLSGTGSDISGDFRILRDFVPIITWETVRFNALAGATNNIALPAGGFNTVDVSAPSGPRIYKLQGRTVGSDSVAVDAVIMYIREKF